MHWGLERVMDGWLTRVEKLGSCGRLPSLNGARDDRARHLRVADGKPCIWT